MARLREQTKAAHICVELLRQEVLSQLVGGEDGGAHFKGGGQFPLPCPAQRVQRAHDRTKGVLYTTYGHAVLGAQDCSLAQCPPVFSFLWGNTAMLALHMIQVNA